MSVSAEFVPASQLKDARARIAELEKQELGFIQSLRELEAENKAMRIGYEVLVQTGERHALDAVMEVEK